MSQPPNPDAGNAAGFFTDVSWKASVIYSVLALIVGGTAAGGVVATKSESKGITQPEADVRYLTIEEADKRRERRDASIEKQNQLILDRLKEIKEKQDRQDEKFDKFAERLYSR